MTQIESEILASPNIFGLYGTGGFAREVMPLVKQNFLQVFQESPYEATDLFFVDVNPPSPEINGVPAISEREFLARSNEKRFFNVAIADSKIREKVVDELSPKGLQPLSIISRDAAIYDGNEIGAGAIICANCVITSNARIGCFFHCNLFSYVAHDCIIGDYVTFAPNVHCNGNVHIHNHAYIGTGAIIKQGASNKPLVIGEGAVVGMGAVVTKDVPAFTTVVGNPARIFAK
jgi:sugar O-acyltransferase (sialic acid O-acetyltransferase NeuD family)